MDPELLSNVQLFKNLPSSELKKIADRMSPVEIPAGTVLFSEGDSGDILYVVAEGALEVIKAAGTPDERLIAVRRQGEFIGIEPDQL
jgi:CRP-like cAMP-binding protein